MFELFNEKGFFPPEEKDLFYISQGLMNEVIGYGKKPERKDLPLLSFEEKEKAAAFLQKIRVPFPLIQKLLARCEENKNTFFVFQKWNEEDIF